MRNFIFALQLIFFSISVFAQNLCGNEHAGFEFDATRTKANIQAIRSGQYVQSRATTYVPIRFHLVADNNAADRATEKSAFLGICQLNRVFAPLDIQFFLADEPFNYINSQSLHINPGSFAGNLQIIQNFTPGVINVFITNKIQFDVSSPGNTLGVYLGDRDVIVVIRDRLDGQDKTLPHEVGHYLSLPHTFFGFEGTPHTSGKAPDVSPSGNPTENMARSGECSNCLEAGDFICDTPPDYNFGIVGASCRSFNLNVTDPCGVKVEPQGTNYMSYFFNCTEDNFTNDQGKLMKQDLQNRFQKRTLRSEIQPATTATITQTPLLKMPANDAVVESYDQVVFEWDPVPNAEYYFLEVDRFTTFNFRPKSFLVKSTSQIVNSLSPNQKFVWRVTPITSLNPCSDNVSEIRTITTGATKVTNTQNPELFTSFKVFPNPIGVNQELTVELKDDESKPIRLELIDLNGRVVEFRESEYSTGTFSFQNLKTSGLYFVKVTNIESEEFSIRRFIVY